MQPVAVALDTLNRSLSGSESRDEDMSAYVNAGDAIREAFNCLVPIVHHCGVDATRPRGHTSLTGAVDAQIAVKRDAANNIISELEWMKDGPEGERLTSRLEATEVGTDEDGDPITSCVVVPSEALLPAKERRLSTAETLALEQLRRALDNAGTEPPVSTYIPPAVSRVVPSGIWREYCLKSSVTDSDKPDTKRKAFLRASENLRKYKVIDVWDDLVWITTGHAGHGGT